MSETSQPVSASREALIAALRQPPRDDGTRMHQAGGICWCRQNHGWEAVEMNRNRGPWENRDDASRSGPRTRSAR